MSTIGSLLPSKNKSSNNPSNGNNCSYKSQQQEKPENFNNFFCSIGKNLAQKISTLPSDRFKSYLKNRVSSSMFLEPPNISEVVALMQALDVNKAVGHDNIPAFFIKVSKFVTASYLNILIDFAFSNGIFPDSCKTAEVIPLHKSGNVNDPNNYRPTSILTCFSKIFEKLLHKRLSEFLNKNNVIILTQYGFQTNFSTSHAILDIITHAYDNININQLTGLFFLDLKKAFDTVNHKILEFKLNHYGIRGCVLNLILSFLERYQYVYIHGINLTTKSNPYGIPQDSTLGPLLFLLYGNDMPNATQSTPRLFADDTCICVNHRKLSNLQNLLNTELGALSEWYADNQLAINPTKSQVLIIPPNLKANFENFSVNVNNASVSANNMLNT